jgi:hypothetical protein
MLATKRIRIVAAGLAVGLAAAGIAAALTTNASASPTSARSAAVAQSPKLSAARFDLNGYQIDAKYTLGRNTGNTFRQTYTHSTVQGKPIDGPLVGLTFPSEDYVALPIGPHELYIAWLDPTSSPAFAIVDAFVMDFVHHVVYDYAPGSDHPESVGTVTIHQVGDNPIPPPR